MICYLAMVFPELQPIKDISMPWLQVHCKCTCTYTDNTDHIQYSRKKKKPELQALTTLLQRDHVVKFNLMQKSTNLTLPLATTLVNIASCVIEHSEHWDDTIRCAICSTDVAVCGTDAVS
jgi:hypothetical protein